ncbi:HD-GYP domain-containing protein [Kurthia senegalensis]|uniref:HD-GYP domain-containing protein n=1 Tax=Kurthia senegalensis TaxID=1033740 RepID=UPI0002FDFEC8|nr:HD-GYP domain-containing protein [Kurthia senegalensis]
MKKSKKNKTFALKRLKKVLKMEGMLTKVSEIRLGSLVSEDVMGNTQFPLIDKGTKITREHLQVLNAFQIAKVKILYATSHNEDEVREEYVQQLEQTFNKPLAPFKRRYKEAVDLYKLEFQSWEAGSKIDIPKLREVMLPLLEDVLRNRVRIFTLNEYSNAKDYLYNHAISTSLIAAVIAQKMNYVKGDVIQLAMAALVADCGMSKISSKIRDKAGSLTKEEFAEIKMHPKESLLMVKDLVLIKNNMKTAIFQHHERLDGSGYPCRSNGNTINIEAHVMAVADIFHAMTCERVYKRADSPFKVIEMIQQEEFGKFHIKPVQALLNCVADFGLGTNVELSNKSIGQIVFVNTNNPTRPVIKIAGFEETIDLSKNKSIYIEKIITKE